MKPFYWKCVIVWEQFGSLYLLLINGLDKMMSIYCENCVTKYKMLRSVPFFSSARRTISLIDRLLLGCVFRALEVGLPNNWQ